MKVQKLADEKLIMWFQWPNSTPYELWATMTFEELSTYWQFSGFLLCPELEDIDNGRIEYDSQGADHKTGDKATYFCINDDYEPPSPKQKICSDQGTYALWTPPGKPECKRSTVIYTILLLFTEAASIDCMITFRYSSVSSVASHYSKWAP